MKRCRVDGPHVGLEDNQGLCTSCGAVLNYDRWEAYVGKGKGKKRPVPEKVKFITMFAREGVEEGFGEGTTTVKFCDTEEEALKELRRWVPEAEDAKEAGETPEFRLYKAVEIKLDVEERVTTTVNVRKEES